MFPFVGAPMFYSAGRRKRKWAVVFCVEGAVALSDVVGSVLPSTSKGVEEESADSEEALVDQGTEWERRRTIDHGERSVVGDASTAVIRLPSSSPLASTSTSLAFADTCSAALTISRPRKHRKRSSSQPTRGGLRSLFGCDDDRARVPLLSSVERYADVVSWSTLECLLEHCANWNFDTFLLNRLSGGHPVVAIGCKMFQMYQFHRVFQLDGTALLLCLRLIENGYRDNPYHNSEHAADVAQAMHCFLQEPPLAAALDPLEKMTCILAAFGHDLYHPGVNQKFLEGSGHFLCSLYKNVSVLENFHWRCLVSVIKESGLFVHLSQEDWRKMLNIFEVLILATDMQRQQEYLNQFKPYLERDWSPHLAEAGERLFVMQILIKCADIANPCRPWMISKEWSVRASTEFFNQGDLERRLGMPVTNFCDRYATSIPKIQSGFMEYVAQPLFADWDQYMKSPLSAFMLRNLRSNCQHWNKMLREQVQQQEQLQQRQVSPASSPGSTADRQISPQRPPASEASSLEEMAELEMQRPDVLQKRRASSSALPRSRSPRSSIPDLPRRVSLPVSTSGGATLWTASANRRLYEAISTSDLANAPVRLRLSHSEVAEESDDEISRKDDIAEGDEEEEGETSGAKASSDGGCSGSGCGTPTPPPTIVVTSAVTEECSTEGVIYSVVDKNLCALMTTPSLQQQQRRYSEPLVLTLASFCPAPSARTAKPSTTVRAKPQTDENSRLSNLMLWQQCMPRRGSLPMTQKELEHVQAISEAAMPLAVRSNSSGSTQPVPALNRAVDVS